MPDDTASRVVIDFEPGSDPLRGWLSSDEGKTRQPFEGWLDLTRLLTAAAVGSADGNPTTQGSEHEDR